MAERNSTKTATWTNRGELTPYTVAILNHLHRQTSATFKVGDVVHSATSECLVEIEKGYDLYEVNNFGWRWGYIVRQLGGEVFFVPAGKLYAPDGAIRHLQIVKPLKRKSKKVNPPPKHPRAA